MKKITKNSDKKSLSLNVEKLRTLTPEQTSEAAGGLYNRCNNCYTNAYAPTDILQTISS